MTAPVRKLSAGGSSALNVTAATSLFTGVGQVNKITVNGSAAAASYVLDSTGTTQAAGNTIYTIPASTAVGTLIDLDWPITQGLAIVPGAGVTLAVSYSQGNQG